MSPTNVSQTDRHIPQQPKLRLFSVSRWGIETETQTEAMKLTRVLEKASPDPAYDLPAVPGLL